MTQVSKLLRKILPASLLGMSGCLLLYLILLPASVLEVLLQVGCEQCFGTSPVSLVVANGTEEGMVEESESPGLPPTVTVDQEPEEPAFLSELGLSCADFLAMDALLGGAPQGPAQTIARIRSGGFAVAAPQEPAARYRGSDGTPGVNPTTIYLTNSVDDTVIAIDAASRAVTGSARVGDRPRGIASSPDGSRLYVANENSGNLSVVDTNGLRELMTIPLPGDAEPYDVAITPDGAEVWVTSHEASGSVHVIDTAALAVTASIRVGRRPVQVAISPDGTLAYVTNEGDNRLSVVDVWTRTVLRSLTVPSPYGVEFDPAGSRVYVTSRTSPGSVRMIDAASDAVLAMWEVGLKPEHLQLDPLGTRLLVTNRLSDFISVINLLSGEVERTIPAPRGLGPLASVPN